MLSTLSTADKSNVTLIELSIYTRPHLQTPIFAK